MFTGTVKVIFKDEETVEKAIERKIRINTQVYFVEKLNPKPRVIKCNTCQPFGHISRLCRNKDNPVCGKCSCKEIFVVCFKISFIICENLVS